MNRKPIPNGYLFPKRYTNYIFLLLFLLYMFDYVDRTVITSLFPFLKADWNLSDTQCALLVSAVYWSILALTFPVSILVDRWSRKKTVGIMAVLWSFATGICALSRTFSHLFSARTMIGIGEAGYAPGGTAMISGLYPQEKRALMMGLWNASIPLGSALGVALGGVIATSWGWRHAFGLVAIPGFVVAILFFFVKDYKTVSLVKKVQHTDNYHKHKKIAMSVRDFFTEFLQKPSLIFTYFGIAAVVFTTTSLITWLPTYFHRVQQLSESQAGLKSSSIMVLALIGAPLGGYFADSWRKKRINARLLFPSLTTFISACLLFLALTVFPGKPQYVLLLVMGVIITAFISAASAVTQDVVHAGLRATSYAIAVIVQHLLGSSAGPLIVGAISDASDIQTALTYLPLALLLASALFFAGSCFYEKDLLKVELIKLEST
jgi:predicted MFS family arabinose efflux permease